jgi:hypothetical protein
MLIMAMILGFRHCVVRKSVAEIGNLTVEKDPGMIRMSNCGAFAKEFCISRQLLATYTGLERLVDR